MWLLIILKSLLHGTYVFPIYMFHFRLRQFGNAFFTVLLPRLLLKSVSDAADGEEISEICRCHIEGFLNIGQIQKKLNQCYKYHSFPHLLTPSNFTCHKTFSHKVPYLSLQVPSTMATFVRDAKVKLLLYIFVDTSSLNFIRICQAVR